MDKTARVFVAIPLAAGLAATVCYVFQGGFGAGHKPLDFALVMLGLPSVLWLFMFDMYAPAVLDALGRMPELFVLVWLPALVNVALFYLLGKAVTTMKRLK